MKVDDLVRVRVEEITDDRVIVRLLYSEKRGIILPVDISRRGDIHKFVRVGRNEVARIKSIIDEEIYLTTRVSQEDITRVENQLYEY